MRFLRLILVSSVTLLCCQPSHTSTQKDNALERGGLAVTSSAFAPQQPIPPRYTCDGGDAFLPVAFSGVPQGAKSVAIVFDDPDAPGGTWTHWIAWNIPTQSASIVDGQAGVVGRNSWDKNAYGGPCPPGGEHRYIFHVYALDTTLELPAASDAAALRAAMAKHVVASGELVGVYTRAK